MSAGKHIVVWPKVRLTVKGKSKVVDRGELVPAGVSDVDLANLVSFGAIAGDAGLSTPSEADSADGDSSKPATVKEVLDEVGDDREKAAGALEVEKARGDDARSTLLEKLEAIANPPQS